MKKKFILLSTVLAVIISAFTFCSNPSSADIVDDIQMTSIYLDNGNLNNARNLANKVISEYKNYSDGYHLLASVFAQSQIIQGLKKCVRKH